MGSKRNMNRRRQHHMYFGTKWYNIFGGKQRMKKEDSELGESLIDITENGHAKMVIDRPIFNQQKLDEGFEAGVRPQSSLKSSCRKACSKCACSKTCCKNFLFGIFPFLSILKGYNVKSDLPSDIISGLTVGIMHIPQGMAYGMLTGLDPVYGLYVSFFPVIVYFFLGTSRHVSMGTFAVACLMVGSAVDKGVAKFGGVYEGCNDTTVSIADINGTNITQIGSTGACQDEIKLQVAMAVTLMVGLIQLGMGVAQLGFITTYLSDPLVSGFTTGAACHVFTSQITHVFGISTDRYSGALKLVYTYRDFFTNIPHTNAVTLIASVICMVFLYTIKTYINQNPKIKPRLKMPVPVELIAVVLGTLISYGANLQRDFGVTQVGDIPVGMPIPKVPNFSMIPDVIADAFAISIVVFAISVSMGKILAKKYDYEINSNQELIAYAACNIVSSFFSAFVSSASLSRSLVQENVGGKTQVVGLVSSALLLMVLLLLGPYFKTLPKCILASIIIVALQGMFRQFFELQRLWKLSKIDFFIWLSTFLATVLLDVDLGLLVGVVIGLLTIVYRVQRPYACVLGQIPNTDIYRDVKVYKEAQEFPRLKIFRFENAIFFVSVEHFRNTLYKCTINPRHLKTEISKAKLKAYKQREQQEVEYNIRNSSSNMDGGSMELAPAIDLPEVTVNIPAIPYDIVILDCSTWSFIDSMGVKALTNVIKEYRDVEIDIYLAFCKAGVREMFEKTGFFDMLDRDKLFPTIHDAVLHTFQAQKKDEPKTETSEDGGPSKEESETSPLATDGSSTDEGLANQASEDERL
ncbi:prestin-like isoform X1 [Mytilus trossulus]|uniref:prestin-like isoform X1 n=2 Tax=Mytilus trossulus TaxID=6551 RepID=UPI003003F139